MGENPFLLLVSRENAAEALRAVFSAMLRNTCSHSEKNTAENIKKEKRPENALAMREYCKKRVYFSLGR